MEKRIYIAIIVIDTVLTLFGYWKKTNPVEEAAVILIVGLLAFFFLIVHGKEMEKINYSGLFRKTMRERPGSISKIIGWTGLVILTIASLSNFIAGVWR